MPRRFDAVHVGHLNIHKNYVECTDLVGLPYKVDSRRAAVGGGYQATRPAHNFAGNFAVYGVIVYQQHRRVVGAEEVGERYFGYFGTLLRRADGRFFQLDREPERAPLPHHRLHADIALHQCRQFFGNGQSQPRAAKRLARRRVDLTEGVEQQIDIIGRDTDTRIVHSHPNPVEFTAFADERCRHPDCSVFGEFDGVGRQVRQHLQQPRLIGNNERRQVGAEMIRKGVILGVGLLTEKRDEFLEYLLKRHRRLVQGHFTRFYFGQVQNVVENVEQRFRRAFDGTDVIALFGVEGRVVEQVDHADDAVHGRSDFVAHVGQKPLFHL